MDHASRRRCGHCGTAVAADASFCEWCGKAIAGAAPVPLRARAGGKRIMHGYTLKRRMHGASGALLAVAILQTIGALLVYGLSGDALNDPMLGRDAKILLAVVFFLAASFWALWWWSRSNPFVAGVVGLVLYVTLHFAAFLVDPSSLLRGIIIKIIIIMVLVKAVMAGAEYRRTMRAQGD